MKHAMYLFLVFTLFSCASYTVETGPKGKTIVKGSCTWEQWQSEAGWSAYDAAGYEPQDAFVSELRDLLQDESLGFLLFSGSWCGDSESEMPKIYKLFDECGAAPCRICLYGLDRDKKDGCGTAAKYNIERVPTLVVLRDGKEAGRIVEYPEKSWEEDIFYLVGGD